MYEALITLDGWTFLAQICNLMIQLFIFKKLLLDPVRKVIAQRKAKADSQIEDARKLRITVLSFGFKYGLPPDADYVLDARFLPNPFWVPELRSHNGLDADVADYVLGQEGAMEFVDRYALALQPVLAGYVRENKRYATIAVGCTGGKHRSVAITELLAQKLEGAGVAVTAVHRDLGRE